MDLKQSGAQIVAAGGNGKGSFQLLHDWIELIAVAVQIGQRHVEFHIPWREVAGLLKVGHGGVGIAGGVLQHAAPVEGQRVIGLDLDGPFEVFASRAKVLFTHPHKTHQRDKPHIIGLALEGRLEHRLGFLVLAGGHLKLDETLAEGGLVAGVVHLLQQSDGLVHLVGLKVEVDDALADGQIAGNFGKSRLKR